MKFWLLLLALLLVPVVFAAAPVINNIYTVPPSILYNESVHGVCNASDADNDTLTYYYNWYVNNVSVDTSIITPDYPDATTVLSGRFDDLRSTSKSFYVGDVFQPTSLMINTVPGYNAPICGISYRYQACGQTYQRSEGVFYGGYPCSPGWSSSGSLPFSIPESCLDENRRYVLSVTAEFCCASSPSPSATLTSIMNPGYSALDGDYLYTYNYGIGDEVTFECIVDDGFESVSANSTSTVLLEAPPCVEDWLCDGYEACVDPALNVSCNSVYDNNACGPVYAGNYSEFAVDNCSYAPAPSGGGGGGGWPVDDDVVVVVNDTLLVQGGSPLFSLFGNSVVLDTEDFVVAVKNNVIWLVIALLVLAFVAGKVFTKKSKRGKRK